MIRAEQIPDEVVEAAARAAFIYYRCVPWDECTDKPLWRYLARAAIAAAINAWPDSILMPAELILPLPNKEGDA